MAHESGPPCSAHSGANSLDNQIALKLGDSSHNDHHRTSQRARSVYVFSEANELDVEMAEVNLALRENDEPSEPSRRTPKPIPHRNGVDERDLSGRAGCSGGGFCRADGDFGPWQVANWLPAPVMQRTLHGTAVPDTSPSGHIVTMSTVIV
jgi:hypothetical protein